MKLRNLLIAVGWLLTSPLWAHPNENYAKLLNKIVDPGQGVLWDHFGSTEKENLSTYLTWVQGQNPKEIKDRNSRMAFWINAHNACVLKFLAEHGPVDDVMKIEGFRDRLKCAIGGSELTQTEMVSQVIRPEFADPRIHFALWWGARGGPRLRPTPYEGGSLDETLKDQMNAALGDERFVQFQEAPPKLVLSPLFDWFRRDFGSGNTAVLEFLRKNLPQDQAKKVPKKLTNVSFSAFDWSLDRSPNKSLKL